MLNITAHGRLGADPEQKHTPTGTELTEFSLAVDTGKDETTWLRCTVWGKRAKVAADYLCKGNAITIAGRGKLATYTTVGGGKGSSLQVSVDDFTLPVRTAQSQPVRTAQSQPQRAAAEVPF